MLNVKFLNILDETNQLLELEKESLPESSQEEIEETHQRSTKELTEKLKCDDELLIDTENIDKNTDYNNLRNSASNRTIVLKKISDNILQNNNSDSTSKMRNNILNKILLSQMELIDRLTKIIARDKKAERKEYDIKPWKELKKDYERQYRRISLSKPTNEESFEADLNWMLNKGEGEDLISILRVQEQSLYTSEIIVERITKAAAEICKREEKKGTIFGKYRVFVNHNVQIEEKCPTIKVEQIYPAFSIVIATEETFLELKEFYPTEQLYQFNSPFELIEKFSLKPYKTVHCLDYLVVEFDLLVPKNWKEIIKKNQAKVIQPIGGSKVIISADNSQIATEIANLPQVKSVTKYEPSIDVREHYLKKKRKQPVTKAQIAEARLKAAQNPNQSRPRNIPIPGILIASFFTTDDREKAVDDLADQGIRIADQPGTTTLVLDVNSLDNPVESLDIIRKQQGLSSLEEDILPTLFNNVARQLIAQEVIPSNPIPNDTSLGLTGKGEVIAVADTGLDTGEIETLHIDFQDKVQVINSLPANALKELIANFEEVKKETSDKYTGHGTHVAGSIVGSGELARSSGESSPPKGMAPEAKLIFQAMEKTPKWTSYAINIYRERGLELPNKEDLYGIPRDLEDLFQPTYDAGARIHSNSWGKEATRGKYDKKCEDLDKFVWENKDFLVIVAAGNDGRHTSASIPAVDKGTLASPALAKNCLAVGASENNRRGEFNDTYGKQYYYRFPYPPFKDQNMVDSIDNIAAFSSRGPAIDYRRKPDLVAPGTFVLSTRSSQIANNNFAEGYYPPAKYHYMYMSGTSMAAPLVAGCAALVRQYLKERRQIKEPTAAIVKATLIHSAQYMDYRYAHSSSQPWADDEQGWGRVDLRTVLNPEEPTKVIFIDQREGLTTGDEDQYKVEVVNNSVKLRATLVYTDFPYIKDKSNQEESEGEQNQEILAEHLVNNLNLTLNPPNDKYRQYYQGNDFDNTGTIDNCNNVEGCIVKQEEVQTGVWTIKVTGAEIKQAPQDYALVISGGIESGYKQERVR